MKESGRGEDPAPSAVVSGASASPSIPDLASRNAAPALTSQPGEVAEDDRAEAARGTHGAAGPIALVDPNETIDPPISKISAPLPASVSATLTEHKPGVYAYGNDEMGYFYIAAEDVPVARAYVDNGGTGSARSSLTNSPMNPRAALGFSPFMPPTPHDSPGPIGHHYQPSPAGSVNGGGAAAHVNYAPSLAHGGELPPVRRGRHGDERKAARERARAFRARAEVGRHPDSRRRRRRRSSRARIRVGASKVGRREQRSVRRGARPPIHAHVPDADVRADVPLRNARLALAALAEWIPTGTAERQPR